MSQLTHQEVLALNKLGRGFSSLTRRDMQAFTKGRLRGGIRGKNKYHSGLLEAIGFVFPRFGVFVEMGVFGGLTRAEAQAQGKLNPKPWFNPALEKRLPRFIDDLQKTFSGFVIRAIEELKIKNAP